MNDQSGQSTSKRLKMSVGKEGQSMHHQQVCRILNLFLKISLLTNGSSLTRLVLHNIELFNSIILNMFKAFFLSNNILQSMRNSSQFQQHDLSNVSGKSTSGSLHSSNPNNPHVSVSRHNPNNQPPHQSMNQHRHR